MYDLKCLELAEYFLRDNLAATDHQKSDLAQEIQDAIEEWICEEFAQTAVEANRSFQPFGKG